MTLLIVNGLDRNDGAIPCQRLWCLLNAIPGGLTKLRLSREDSHGITMLTAKIMMRVFVGDDVPLTVENDEAVRVEHYADFSSETAF